MTLPQGYALADVPVERREEFAAVDGWAFASTMKASVRKQVEETLEWDRSRAVTTTTPDGGTHGEFVAVHSSFEYTMRVPGGTVPTSGLTWVGVHPGHRRRGLLTAMIADHFARSRARGEAVSTLIAAETAIYQRFEYGLACPVFDLTLPRGVRLHDVDGSRDLRIRLEDADLERHGEDVRAVLARDTRPGTMVAPSAGLLANQFLDPEEWREGRERQRIAIVEDADGPAAFALFARKLPWDSPTPDGKGSTSKWAAATAVAEHRLFSVLSDLDLMASFRVIAASLDDPLLHLAKDIRALQPKLGDQLWARILDVPAALQARTYAADVTAIVEVGDPVIAENSHPWHVSIADGVATVTRAERDAAVDIRMPMRYLSAAYLGGTDLLGLARAGLVTEIKPGVAAALAAAFRSDLAPRSTFYF